MDDNPRHKENGSMTQQCNKYTEKFISRFVDNELDPARTMEFSSHLGDCPDCAEVVAKFQKLGIVFNTHAARQIARVSPVDMATTPLDCAKPTGIFGRMTDHLYIKLASLTAVAALLILAVFDGAPPVGPSAIVKSLDTNASSVMIIETIKEKHTIIWFSET
jgi:anti-sigma factor RsiW